MESAAGVESPRAVSRDAASVADGRREAPFQVAVGERAVEGFVPGGLRTAQEVEQVVVQLKLHVVVDPPHYPNPETLESEARGEGTTRAADAELVLWNELRGRAEVHQQGVLPDREGHVVRRRRGLFDLQVERQVENGGHDQDRIETRRSRVERRITGQVRMGVQQLDDLH